MVSAHAQISNIHSRNTPRHVKPAPANTNISRLSIIIPCFNEANTISKILDKVADALLPSSINKEIIVINDNSTDDTDLMIREYLEENRHLSIKYIQHAVNLGKGAAVQTGIAHACGDYLLIQDADLEYDPSEYHLLIEPIVSGHADVVYGSRFMGGHPHRILFFWHTAGNKLLTLISNVLTNMNLTDAHTCYKVLPAELIRNLNLTERRFAFDAELNGRISRIPGIRIYEVGISYYGRTFSEGKKIRFKDAIRTLWCLFKNALLPLKGNEIIERWKIGKQRSSDRFEA